MTTKKTSLFSGNEHVLDRTLCPQCHGGELVMRFGKRGPFLGCDHYPNCDYIQPLKQNDGHIVKQLDLSCPQCTSSLVLRQGRYGMFIGCLTYPECDYSTSTETKTDNLAIACPECNKGHLVERTSRQGKTFYACEQYPRCRYAVNNKPIAGICQQCGFNLLMEKKLAGGKKIQCADRKCHTYQSPKLPENEYDSK
jgi:putative DNA topoisomerase